MIPKLIFWLRIVFRMNYALEVVYLIVKIQKATQTKMILAKCNEIVSQEPLLSIGCVRR